MNIMDLYKKAIGEAAVKQPVNKPTAKVAKPKSIVKKTKPVALATVEKPVAVVEKKKRGRPKKSVEEKKVISIVEKKIEKKAEPPKNAYEKFKALFEDHLKQCPENRRIAYKDTQDVILSHIKELSENSDEYNDRAMHQAKGINIIQFCMDKQFGECYELMKTLNYEQACEQLCMWVDEYFANDADIKKYEESKKKKEKSDADIKELMAKAKVEAMAKKK